MINDKFKERITAEYAAFLWEKLNGKLTEEFDLRKFYQIQRVIEKSPELKDLAGRKLLEIILESEFTWGDANEVSVADSVSRKACFRCKKKHPSWEISLAMARDSIKEGGMYWASRSAGYGWLCDDCEPFRNEVEFPVIGFA